MNNVQKIHHAKSVCTTTINQYMIKMTSGDAISKDDVDMLNNAYEMAATYALYDLVDTIRSLLSMKSDAGKILTRNVSKQTVVAKSVFERLFA